MMTFKPAPIAGAGLPVLRSASVFTGRLSAVARRSFAATPRLTHGALVDRHIFLLRVRSLRKIVPSLHPWLLI
jgi:hypothetical protein